VKSKYFSLFQTARKALGPTQSPNECISTAFFERVSGWGVKPTTYPPPTVLVKNVWSHISTLPHA